MEVFGINFAAGGESECSLKNVLELPDIARKIVAPELLHGLRREPRRRGARLRGKALEDGGRDEADVVTALPQRRHRELADVGPVEQAPPHAPAPPNLPELLV